MRWEILDAFRDAAEQVGIPKTSDYNAGNYEGSAYFHVTQRRGVRWSTASAFLKPAMARPISASSPTLRSIICVSMESALPGSRFGRVMNQEPRMPGVR